jgi:hypothetical protein
MNEVALFESALRAAVPMQPDPRIGATLVPRLADVAHTATIEAETHPVRQRPRSRPALVARVGIAVALIPLVLAGLAFAGVTMPSPARSAFEKVGITLPHQPSSHSNGTPAGRSPDRPAGTTETQTATSETQSKGNSAAAHQHALEQRHKARGKAIGHNGTAPPGHARAPGPPAHSNAGGVSGSHAGTHPTPKPHTPHGHANGHSK